MNVFIHLDRKRLHSMSCLSNDEKWSYHSDIDRYDRYDMMFDMMMYYDVRWYDMIQHDVIYDMMWGDWVELMYTSTTNIYNFYSDLSITILMLTHHHVIPLHDTVQSALPYQSSYTAFPPHPSLIGKPSSCSKACLICWLRTFSHLTHI